MVVGSCIFQLYMVENREGEKVWDSNSRGTLAAEKGRGFCEKLEKVAGVYNDAISDLESANRYNNFSFNNRFNFM